MSFDVVQSTVSFFLSNASVKPWVKTIRTYKFPNACDTDASLLFVVEDSSTPCPILLIFISFNDILL